METPNSNKKRQSVNFTKNFFEISAWEQKSTVVGIDEVGRGCLAGPLVTAAVILPFKTNRLLQDSKLLEAHERDEAYAWIIRNCAYQIGIVHNRIIDQHNIWQATLMAMKKALVNLMAQPITRPSAILVDAMPLTLADTDFGNIPVYYFPKGERKSSSIAAASIVAKVTRDALMGKFATLFPGYDLEQHKGYGTKSHQACIKALGQTIIHRTSFCGSITEETNDYQQQTLC